MASKGKKKKAAKKAARYSGKRAPATKWSGADARRQATTAPKGPRAQALPGMSKIRDAKLDGYCEDAGEGLDKINAGTAAVNDAKNVALKRMRDKGMSSYVHAGVRFTRNEGVDSISVKRMKEKEATGSVFTQPGASAGGVDGEDMVGEERRDRVAELDEETEGDGSIDAGVH